MKRQEPRPFYYYRLYGSVLRCDFPLGLSPLRRRSRGYVTVQEGAGAKKLHGAVWFHTVRDERGATICRFGRCESEYVMAFRGRGSFRFSPGRNQISYDSALIEDGARPNFQVLQALLMTQVLPYFLSLAKFQLLHGATVNIRGRAVVLLGPQGQGKSTLAAAFVREGFKILGDDTILLKKAGRKILAVPSFPEVRLSPKTARALFSPRHVEKSLPAVWKVRMGVRGSFYSKPLPLGAIFLLGNGRRVRVEGMSLAHRWRALLNHSFRFDFSEPQSMKKEMAMLSLIVESVPLNELIYPRKIERLREVVRATVTMMRSEGGR